MGVLRAACWGLALWVRVAAGAEVYYLSHGTLLEYDGRNAAPAPLMAREPTHGPYVHIFDRARIDEPRGESGTLFLVGAISAERGVARPDLRSGMDLRLVDSAGHEVHLSSHALRAKFDGTAHRVAHSTTDCEILVHDVDSMQQIAAIPRGYDPSWKPDGGGLVYSRVPEGSDSKLPGVFQLGVYDLSTGEASPLTDGAYDDTRPEYSPDGRWILFVSGSRSGLASFWEIAAKGGSPVQLTNIGKKAVDKNFVPTPYKTTIWSRDGRHFIYDFKNGDKEETWRLEFSATGTLASASKLADGLSPQWWEEGRSVVVLRSRGEESVPELVPLP